MQNQETEFKNILTKEQFDNIKATYHFQPAFQQTNVYFDTANNDLKKQQMGMRMRLFADDAEQTLKTPAPNHIAHQLIETTDKLQKTTAITLLNNNQIYQQGAVAQVLKQHHIKIAQLKIIAWATTTRRLLHLPAGLLTLDQTEYPNHTCDYELEMEIDPQNYQFSSNFFQKLLVDFHITKVPVRNKIVRALANYHHK